MRHLEIHTLSSAEELNLAYRAGLIDDWQQIIIHPTCDKCRQMLLLAKDEKLFIVVDEQNSQVLCSGCLTQTLGDDILGT